MMREFGPFRSEVAMLKAQRDQLKYERDELLMAARLVLPITRNYADPLTHDFLLKAIARAEGRS